MQLCCIIKIFYYLYYMTHPRHMIIRKWLAFLLLAILLYIQAVKVLHQHDHTTLQQTGAQDHSATLIKAAYACDICNYHFTKDAGAPEANAYITLPLIGYPIFCLTATGEIPAGKYGFKDSRGPPVWS